jgi:hypothetical protein
MVSGGDGKCEGRREITHGRDGERERERERRQARSARCPIWYPKSAVSAVLYASSCRYNQHT